MVRGDEEFLRRPARNHLPINNNRIEHEQCGRIMRTMRPTRSIINLLLILSEMINDYWTDRSLRNNETCVKIQDFLDHF